MSIEKDNHKTESKGEKKISSFKDLLAWKNAHQLVLEIYRITRRFPAEEKFSLVNQMRRSAISVTSNIAEGFGRNTGRDKAHFYAIAKGSALELQSQLLISKDLEFITGHKLNTLEGEAVEISKLLSGLIKSAANRSVSLVSPHTHTNPSY